MIERLRQLAPREQAVLGIGAALAIGIIAWSFIWVPLQTTVDELRESVRDRSRLVVDLRRAASLSSTAATGAFGASEQEYYALVDATARPLGLASSISGTRLDPATGTMRVTIQNAPFSQLVEWLMGLEREYGIRAGETGEVRLAPSNAGPGLVSGQIVLNRS